MTSKRSENGYSGVGGLGILHVMRRVVWIGSGTSGGRSMPLLVGLAAVTAIATRAQQGPLGFDSTGSIENSQTAAVGQARERRGLKDWQQPFGPQNGWKPCVRFILSRVFPFCPATSSRTRTNAQQSPPSAQTQVQHLIPMNTHMWQQRTRTFH